MTAAVDFASAEDALSAIDSAVDYLRALDLETAPTSTAGLITAITTRQRRLDALTLHVLDTFDRHGIWRADGAASGAAWLRANLRLTARRARAQVRTARRLRDLPVMSAALAAGSIAIEHVHAVADAMAATPQRAETIAAAEPTFAAAAQRLDPAGLAKVVARWTHTVDPLGVIEAEKALHTQRHLSVSRTFGGAIAINGLLAPEPGAIVLGALEALSTADYRERRGAPGPSSPDGDTGHGDTGHSSISGASRVVDDERTPGQRRADALTALARRYLDSGQAPEIAGARPHLTVTVALASLAAPPGETGHDGADLDRVGPISTEAARRIGCDAILTAMGIDHHGQPTSYGRTQRTVPPQLRKLLVVRDRGCVFPGCDRPAAWTQAHHLVHWSRGGPTDLENLALVCEHHHHSLHEGGFTVRGSPANGLRFYRPDGTLLERVGFDAQDP